MMKRNRAAEHFGATFPAPYDWDAVMTDESPVFFVAAKDCKVTSHGALTRALLDEHAPSADWYDTQQHKRRRHSITKVESGSPAYFLIYARKFVDGTETTMGVIPLLYKVHKITRHRDKVYALGEPYLGPKGLRSTSVT